MKVSRGRNGLKVNYNLLNPALNILDTIDLVTWFGGHFTLCEVFFLICRVISIKTICPIINVFYAINKCFFKSYLLSLGSDQQFTDIQYGQKNIIRKNSGTHQERN